MGQDLPPNGDAARQREHQTAQGVEVLFAVFFGQKNANAVFQLCQFQPGVRLEFVFADIDDAALVFVVLVLNVAHDFFNQILDRQQPVDTAMLIHHKRHVTALCAHIQQHVEHGHGGRDKDRGSQD